MVDGARRLAWYRVEWRRVGPGLELWGEGSRRITQRVGRFTWLERNEQVREGRGGGQGDGGPHHGQPSGSVWREVGSQWRIGADVLKYRHYHQDNVSVVGVDRGPLR